MTDWKLDFQCLAIELTMDMTHGITKATFGDVDRLLVFPIVEGDHVIDTVGGADEMVFDGIGHQKAYLAGVAEGIAVQCVGGAAMQCIDPRR